MALPPWTVELLKRGVADLARQVTDNETAASLKEQAAKLVDDLPKAARERVDSILRQAEATARPIKEVWQSGVLWSGGKLSLTPTRLINATGRLLDPRGSGVGIPADALAAALPYLSGDGSHIENANLHFCQQIADAVARRYQDPTGSVRIEHPRHSESLGAIVTHSLDASLALVATLGNRGGCLHVPRCCAVSITDDPVDELLIDRLRKYSRGAVREFGRIDGSDRWKPDHFAVRDEHGGSESSGRKPHRRHVLVRLPVADQEQSLITQKNIAQDDLNSWTDVVVVPVGTVFLEPWQQQREMAVNCLVTQLRAGADLVVLGGGVLAGTPGLSLIVGRQTEIERLRKTPRFSLAAAVPALTAIAATSISLQAAGNSPVAQLAAVSEQNLLDRASRLATQLGGCESVTSARVTDQPASIGLTSDTSTLASRQVVVTISESRDVSTVARRLAEGPIGLLCRTEANELIIDLRWVTPDQQTQIVELLKQQ